MGGEREKALQALKEQYKYDKNNHKLLYDIAMDYRSMKDDENTIRYLEFFLKTRPKNTKETPKTINEKGEIEVRIEDYYKYSEETLEKIKQRKKKENFFKNGVPQQQ